MPALAKTSLVGRLPAPNAPGRGEAGVSVLGLTPPAMEAILLLVGPIEARALGVRPLLAPPAGVGEGEGEVDGGRRVAIYFSLFTVKVSSKPFVWFFVCTLSRFF